MRIISGSLKGRSIDFLKNSETRPLKDSVRENIFNVISHSNFFNVSIAKSNVLDIYSGVGSFGLECISRSAKKVTFIENSDDAIKQLNKNINVLSIHKQTKIINNDVFNVLNEITDETYEIIFLDPPFDENNFIQILELICKFKIYKKNHIVVIHREKKSKDNLSDILDIKITKEYGRSKIIFGKFLI